jgi:DNA-binding NarL/FixJ family response regulator
MIKIAIADDHQLFRDGLKRLLLDEPDMEVIWSVNDGNQLLERLHFNQPDVMLLDIQMPNLTGIESIPRIKTNFPSMGIIVLTMHNEKPYIKAVKELGVNGYLFKNTANEILTQAIRKVSEGGEYFPAEVLYILNQQTVEDVINLSKRELEVLSLIAQEYSNADIADKLFLSVETINTHRKNLLRKLDVRNTAGLVKTAIQLKLI